MQRKVIQIANSTHLISLPRDWIRKYNVKKGDALELTEKNNSVIVSTDKIDNTQEVSVNLDGLDRTSIMLMLRSLYRLGYDAIEIHFHNQTATHHRTMKEVKIISIIHEEVNRLVGVEIVQQRENYCLIKNISTSSIDDFAILLRRTFGLLIDASNDLVEGIKKNDKVLVETIEEKHDTLTKFVSYCLRLLNKRGFSEKHDKNYYHILANIDLITDMIKYTARYYLQLKNKPSAKSVEILEKINKCVQKYQEFFFKFNKELMNSIILNRDEILREIAKMHSHQSEILLVNNFAQVLELLKDIVECRIALEY